MKSFQKFVKELRILDECRGAFLIMTQCQKPKILFMEMF
jgi:hypothetical protein